MPGAYELGVVLEPWGDSFTSMGVTLNELNHLGLFFLLTPGMESGK
jgi:hypothetical protein